MPEEREQPKAGAEEPAGRFMNGVKEALDQLSDRIAMYGGNTCDQLAVTALSDEAVQRAFAARVEGGELFCGVYCPQWSGRPQEAAVLFEFRLLPPRVALCPTYFLVMLNVFTGQVEKLIDPCHGVGARVCSQLAPFS